MNNEVCLICGEYAAPLFTLKIMAKYDVAYFHCRSCGFTRTEEPHWLNEAYTSAISITDTGILQRNWNISAKLACALYYCIGHQGTFVDVAGGYGILTRLMRDYGFNYYWEDKYCDNLFAKGFEAKSADLEDIRALSGIEVIEHTVEPIAFVSDVMGRHSCRTFLFTTETYAGTGPPRPDWWYLSTASGQHISFFHQRTLQRLGERLGLRLYSARGLHIFTDRPLRNVWLFNLLKHSVAVALSRGVRAFQASLIDRDHVSLVETLKG